MPRVIIRRSVGRKPTSLTAAAQRVDVTNPAAFRASAGMSGVADDWQADAWRYLELVGELQYVVSWRAWSCSRCRLVASALDDQGEPMGSIPDDDPKAEQVRKIVNDIAGGVSGQTEIMHRIGYLLSAIGECWVAMIVRDAAREQLDNGAPTAVDITRPGYQLEQWYVFNRDQIKQSQGTVELKLPDGTKHEFNPDVDIMFRVWLEHPRDPSKPISMIWSNREVLDGIVQSGATIKAANNSRLVGNGILFVPQEMSLPQQTPPVARPDGTPDTNMPVVYQEPNSAQQLQDLLYDVASTAKRDPNSQAAMLPIIAAVPGEYIKMVNWIRPGSDIPETTLKIQDADIRRLAMGLDVAPERLFGMSEGNHWSAWAIDENDIRVHVSPLVEVITKAFTQEILREKLTEIGIEPDQYIVWYDTTALTQDPDKTDEAKDGFDRGAIKASALREHLGFDDEDGYDFTTADGWVELALDKIALDPANASVFMPILEAAAAKVGLEIKAPAPALPPGSDPSQQDQPQDGQQPAEPTSSPEGNDSEQPPIQAAALTMGRWCVNRGLELANKRRRTRADADVYRGIPIELAHTRLAPVQIGEASSLIQGWDVGIVDDDLLALGVDPRTFRNMVEGVATLALITASPPLITQSMIWKGAA